MSHFIRITHKNHNESDQVQNVVNYNPINNWTNMSWNCTAYFSDAWALLLTEHVIFCACTLHKHVRSIVNWIVTWNLPSRFHPITWYGCTPTFNSGSSLLYPPAFPILIESPPYFLFCSMASCFSLSSFNLSCLCSSAIRDSNGSISRGDRTLWFFFFFFLKKWSK